MKQFNSLSRFDDLELVEESFEVIVVGGGPSGIAAACTAAQNGRKTLVIEKNGFLGGAAVAGLSGTICGLFTTSKTKQCEQLVFGFADEFVQRMKKHQGLSKAQKYGHTLVYTHDPLTYKLVSEKMILERGGDILFHTSMIAAIIKEGWIKSIIVNTKSGFLKLKAKQFIDASGDGDLAYRSGFKYTVGDNGKIQNPTMIFRMGNINLPKLRNYWGDNTISPDHVSEAIMKAKENGATLPREKIWIFPMPNGQEVLMNTTRIIGTDGRELNVLNAIDHSEAEIEGRKQITNYSTFFKLNIPGFENAYTIDTGAEVGIRQTRTIDCVEKLTNEAVVNCKKPVNGIAKSAWPIELHSGAKPKVHWLLDEHYTVPMGALIPKESKNLVICGRCLCAEHEAMASARVTAQCFEYGKAAAMIADEAIKHNKPIADIQAKIIIRRMKATGSQL